MSTMKDRFGVIYPPMDVGAEIFDLNLSEPMDAETMAEVQLILNERSVIVFRDQKLSPQDQIKFAGCFGEVERHLLHKQYGLDGYPELLLIGNVKKDGRYIGIHDGAAKWHTDLSYKALPTSYSFLYGTEIPHDTSGNPLGDTLFVSTAAAYHTLPDNLKSRVAGLKAVHRFGDQYRERLAQAKNAGVARLDLDADQIASVPEVIHPIVRTHPTSGKKCIFVNEFFTSHIVGMSKEESAELLALLYAHCVRPETIYRHKWKVGDLLVWDNPATQHQATFDYGPEQRRLLRRVVIRGSAPF